MDRMRLVRPVACALLLACAALAAQAAAPADNRLLGDEQDGTNWPAYGRTFSESHYSPLDQINTKSVQRLGLAWSLDLDVTNSLTAPLEVDGVIYLAAGFSIVHAVDVRTGKLLWRHDPGAARASGERLRGGWGIRGLAYWDKKVYVGTQDGRLLALDARTGKQIWSVQTLIAKGLFISGPPRVFNGKVIIGNAGPTSCRPAATSRPTTRRTGKQVWRFFVVPAKPGGVDSAASDDVMAMAAQTWTGQWWRYGGGGHVWNAITYDPEFNRIYIGTGNGAPWNWKLRSPGGGDNLFLCLDRRAGCRHRPVRLALPDHARRRLGLRFGDRHDAGDDGDRRRSRARSSCMRRRTASSM